MKQLWTACGRRGALEPCGRSTGGRAGHPQDRLRAFGHRTGVVPRRAGGEDAQDVCREGQRRAGGINGKKIELVIYDDGGDANKARTFATRLVEDDKVIAMVGGSTPAPRMAMIPVFEEAKIPFISLAGAIEIVDPVRKFVFKTPHTDKMACEKIFEDMKARNLTKIGMISRHRRLRQIHARAMPEGRAGRTASRSSPTRPTARATADMTPQLTKIKNTAGVQARGQSRLRPGPGAS